MGIIKIRQVIVINGGKTELSLIPHSGTNYGAALGAEIVLNSASIFNPNAVICGEHRLLC